MQNNKKGKRGFRKPKSDIETKTIQINKVFKVTKGGRNQSFSALVAAGNKKGKVGLGFGKALEVRDAIEKASDEAKRNLIEIPIVDTTVPHEIEGRFNKSKVLIMPAKEGTGIISGGTSRAVVELAGIKDVLTKSYGSRNKINTAKATLDGLMNLRTKEEIFALRGKNFKEEK